jgi:two-component system, OmpR family, sensor kinase
MSSSPPPDTGSPPKIARWSLRTNRWSLRTKLSAVLVALLAALCLVFGVVTEVALHQTLIRQTDARLQAAGARSEEAARRPGGPDHDEPHGTPPFLSATGQAPGTLGAHIAGSVVTSAAYVNQAGAILPLSANYNPILAAIPVDGRPYTRTLGVLGEYRLQATREQDGDVLVVGLPLNDVNTALYQLAAVEITVALGALLVAGLGGAAIVRRTLRPLRRVAGTARRVAELPLHRGEVALAERVPEIDTDPGTEVGQVGAALNRMLGHIDAALAARQASENRLRQFAADASHELRTPLASIRGYAELARRKPGSAEPEVAHVLSRIESQATRMTSLVEDLLLLARLDAGRPVENTPVDLSALVVDGVGDAHAAGPDHRWQLQLPDEPVIVTGDSVRLQQVLANLLTNARTHTPALTTVSVSLATQDGHAVLEVADNGPGIPADLLPTIFDRFSRGDTSRSRAAGSTGLGLAIVDAVVSAHHGTVEARSRPGHTAVTVRLPRMIGASSAIGGSSQPERSGLTRAG